MFQNVLLGRADRALCSSPAAHEPVPHRACCSPPGLGSSGDLGAVPMTTRESPSPKSLLVNFRPTLSNSAATSHMWLLMFKVFITSVVSQPYQLQVKRSVARCGCGPLGTREAGNGQRCRKACGSVTEQVWRPGPPPRVRGAVRTGSWFAGLVASPVVLELRQVSQQCSLSS